MRRAMGHRERWPVPTIFPKGGPIFSAGSIVRHHETGVSFRTQTLQRISIRHGSVLRPTSNSKGRHESCEFSSRPRSHTREGFIERRPILGRPCHVPRQVATRATHGAYEDSAFANRNALSNSAPLSACTRRGALTLNLSLILSTMASLSPRWGRRQQR